MAFSIEFSDRLDEQPYDDPQIKAANGILVLGDDFESFLSNLGEWTRERYRTQWMRELSLLMGGASKVALITTYSSPEISSHLELWALYRDEEMVRIQNQLLFYDDLEANFSVENAREFLKNRETKTEDGAPISEWNVSFDEIKHFVDQAA